MFLVMTTLLENKNGGSQSKSEPRGLLYVWAEGNELEDADVGLALVQQLHLYRNSVCWL